MAFISLDGGEGVGKSTQIQRLKNILPHMYPSRSFVFTREPGGTPFGEIVRSVILSDEAGDIDGEAMFGLFAAARADHVRRVIKPALVEGKVVISDRFVAATWAYQRFAQDNPISDELFSEHLKQLGVFPDLTILLDMEPEESQGRVLARRTQESTHFDEREIAFHARLREGYDSFARVYGAMDEYRVAMIDAGQSVEQVHREILETIDDLLGE